MYFVYILEAQDHAHWYVGLTEDVDRRLAEHNAGQSPHTMKFHPWVLKSYVSFRDRACAENFERYLKSHSGRAFVKKHF